MTISYKRNRYDSKSWFEDIWFEVTYRFLKFRTLCKQIFYRGPRNIIRWIPVIWEDADWDYYQLLEIMEFKFRNMAREHKNDPHHANNERRARQLTIAAHLCNRLKTEDYWGRPCFGGNDVSLRKQDKEMLGRIITKYLDHWWC